MKAIIWLCFQSFLIASLLISPSHRRLAIASDERRAANMRPVVNLQVHAARCDCTRSGSASFGTHMGPVCHAHYGGGGNWQGVVDMSLVSVVFISFGNVLMDPSGQCLKPAHIAGTAL
ncbi:hypothetical protein PVAP13_5NG313973 [Panicum virgatum]|uniref:Secreted protein n=1 Tax=Panicum virgatum TaxID=38727 RepID=A0A8T0RU64_PANVG|nr:hypothetical protein PVAP13_5NG313973 [Panicum virgatum]